jgi:mRNA interferase MazF
VGGHEQGGRRPVLVVSHDVFNAHSGTAIVMAITSRPPRAGFPLTLKLDTPGLPKQSWIKIGQVRTISTERLGARLGRTDEVIVARAIEGWNEICG